MMRAFLNPQRTCGKSPAINSRSPFVAPGRERVVDILFPDSDYALAHDGRIREVLSRSKAVKTVRYPSCKLNRQVHCESSEEAIACEWADILPSVARYQEQPCRIRYQQGGRRQTHIPDLLVWFDDGRKQFLEIKSKANASLPESVARTWLMQRDLPRWGYEYAVLTNEDLNAEPARSAVRRILSYGRMAVDLRAREVVLRHVRQSGRVRWDDALQGCLGHRGREAVCRLVMEGQLSFNFAEPLTGSTVFLYQGKEVH